MLEKDDFPLMREFVNAREYMQELLIIEKLLVMIYLICSYDN